MLDPQQQVTRCANVALCVEHKECGSLLTLQGHFRIYHGDKMRVLAARPVVVVRSVVGRVCWFQCVANGLVPYIRCQAVKSVLRLCGLRTRHDVQ